MTLSRRTSASGPAPDPAAALAAAAGGTWRVAAGRVGLDPVAATLFGLAPRSLPLARWLEALAPADRVALGTALDNAGAPIAMTVHAAGLPLLVRGSAGPDGWQGLVLALPPPQAPPGLSARDEFVAGISHQLRTPLHAIVGFARLARAYRPADTERHHLEHIEQAAQLMLRVVNDLLDLARLEAGRLEIEPDLPLDLPALAARVLGLAAALRQDKPIRVYAAVDPALPARLRGDALRIEQVLVNLLGNALKFTDRGMVVLGAKLRARHGDQVTLRLSVSDTGVGIALDRLDRIGRPFERATAPGQPAGTGLGLAVVRRLLELHDTRLKVASVAGGGTICWFDLTLPVDSDGSEGTPPPADTAVFSADRRLHDTVAALWRAHGQALLPATAAERAARWVVDTALPDAAARADAARRLGRTLHLVSADAVPEGGHDIVALPLLAAAAFGGAGGDTIEPDPRLVGRRLLVVEDNPINQQVIAGLLRHLGAHTVLCSRGREALAHLAEGAFDAVLLDLQLGAGEHGLDVARAIRATEAGATLPLLFLSAHLDTADRIAAGALGALACLAKPCEPADLRALLGPLPRRAAPLAPPPALAPPPLRALFAGVWPAQRAAIAGADSAAALRGAVHALRGSLAMLGDRDAIALAREVEDGLAAGTAPGALPVAALLDAADALAHT